jgi:hypothetical protein
MEITMASNEEKNEVLVMVLSDLAAICQKLADNSALPDALREQARQFVTGFNVLLPYRGKGSPMQHAHGEELLIKIARFLPSVLDVKAEPATLREQ